MLFNVSRAIRSLVPFNMGYAPYHIFDRVVIWLSHGDGLVGILKSSTDQYSFL